MDTCIESNVLEGLLELLKLEQIEENIFRGQSQDLGFRSVYGGECWARRCRPLPDRSAGAPGPQPARLFSQAGGCPPADRLQRRPDPRRHELHDPPGRGRSEGPAIFSMSASFQIDEPGFEHQDPAPSVPGPEGLAFDLELANRFGDDIPAPCGTRSCAGDRSRSAGEPDEPLCSGTREPARTTGSRPSTGCPTIRGSTSTCWPMHPTTA